MEQNRSSKNSENNRFSDFGYPYQDRGSDQQNQQTNYNIFDIMGNMGTLEERNSNQKIQDRDSNYSQFKMTITSPFKQNYNPQFPQYNVGQQQQPIMKISSDQSQQQNNILGRMSWNGQGFGESDRDSLEKIINNAQQFGQPADFISQQRYSMMNQKQSLQNKSFEKSSILSFQRESVQNRYSQISNNNNNNNLQNQDFNQQNNTVTNNNRLSFPSFNFGTNEQNGQFASNRSSIISKSNQNIENEQEEEKAKVQGCNCKKSKCLKLYCECFSQGLVCGPQCNCNSCCNSLESHEREHAVKQCLLKNPFAFQKRLDQQLLQGDAQLNQNKMFNIQDDQDENSKNDENENYSSNEMSISQQQQQKNIFTNQSMNINLFNNAFINKGCNCKKTFCRKKYCECFNSGIKCTYLCKCEQCKNGECDEHDEEDKQNKLQGRRQQLTNEELLYLKNKKIHTMDIEEQINLEQKRQTVQIIGRGIVDVSY